ncbi:cytochrome P450 4V2-like [Hydractinia symbiolongicarpus]|uniref:cytochrome P450 4V2-like n=1 Tax=Hydractinia symbiolongicarpus TaxID=13093 RepID=UPI0025507C10|nr:cytochrome P450 4V2-like [Hydractinia symbiolongicarpus]XP_057313638.1 cytochrome P450 4V2-like [Hydractinia symbiolongicarpus]
MIGIILGTAAALVCSCIFLHISWKLYTSKLSFLPSPPSIPFVGHVLLLEHEPYKLFYQFQNFFNTYGDTFVIWIGYVPLIFSSNIDYVAEILSSKDMIKKSTLYWSLCEWLGTGLLTSYGSKWIKRRRLITPTFHFNILNDFMSIFMEHSKGLVESFKLECDTGQAIDVQVPISLAALDVICETAMGVKINSQQCTTSQYAKSVHSMNSHLQLRQRSPWLWPDFIYKQTSSGKSYYKDLNVLHDFTIDIINKRIKSRKILKESTSDQSNPRKKVFLDMLLDLYDEGEIDIDGIREEVDTFMFEGHDTISAGLSWILYLLGRHPEIQRKLHSEIDKVDASENLEKKILELKYLEGVIKEGLRLHPPVALFARMLEEDTVINNNVFPKRTELGVAVMALHHNENYWDEPEEFIPDRFLDDDILKRHPYCFVPFSAGYRNCIGQKFAMREEKILLFHVMSKFRLESIQEEDDVQHCFEIIHRSGNGLMIKFFSR